MQEDLLGARHLNTQRTRCRKSTWCSKVTWCTAFKYFHHATLLGAANLLGALHYHQVLLLDAANSSFKRDC